MAANATRRVQREIEIAEKKVNDGVKEFNELWRKVEEAQARTHILRAKNFDELALREPPS